MTKSREDTVREIDQILQTYENRIRNVLKAGNDYGVATCGYKNIASLNMSTHLKSEVLNAVEKYAKETVPKLNDKWRKRMDKQQRINNLVLANKCDEFSRYVKSVEFEVLRARIEELEDCIEGLPDSFAIEFIKTRFERRLATLTQKLEEL